MDKKRILIVDDNPGIGESLSDIFKEKGYLVSIANKGSEAIDKLKQTDFNAALIDIKLPDISGIELLKEIKEINPEIICMIITGNASVENAVNALEQRVSAYITKPLDMDDVLNRIKEALDKQRLKQELKESKESLKILFDYAPDAYYISDLKGNFIDGNKAAERVIGYKREELIGKSFLKLKLLSLADISKAAKALAKNIMGQPTGPDEFVLNRKDNSKVIVEISTYPVKIKGKTLALGIARDITERKQAEENLKNAKDELQMILDSVPAIIFYKDIEGRIIQANKTLADALKMPVKDIVGKTTEELFPKEQAENMRKDDREVIVSGKPKRDIIQPYKTPDGIRWLNSDKIPYINKEGKVTGIIGLAKDITVQRKSEEELKQSYQRLKKTMDAAIETMSKIIEAKDPYTSGHQHRVCQLAVPLARELGLSPDKIEGIRIASLIHDIGKIGLPTEILSKPTKLTDIEFSLIKGHSQIGYDILKSIDFPYPVAQIVLQHHERLNGSGYPQGFKDEDILLEARIIGLADVVEAMSSFRPYRPALGIDKALEEISKNKDTLYDPEVVDACLKLFKEKGFKLE